MVDLEKFVEDKKKKEKKILKYLGFTILGLVLFLIWRLDTESIIFKRNVKSGAKTFYYDKSYLKVSGAWNTTYKTSVEINCYKDELICTLIQASLYSTSDMLDVYKQDFRVKEWNNNYIKSFDEGIQYKFELNINLKNEDVIYTKHPLSKVGILGHELKTSTFQLYDGWKVDMNINEKIVKEAKWLEVPLLKFLKLLFPIKENIKIDLF